MKRMGYTPALVVILLICSLGVGVFGFLSAQTFKKISGYKSSDELYKKSVLELEAAQRALEENQKTDKIYGEHLKRWEEREGALDELALKQKIQQIAQETGVQIYESAALNAPEKDDAAASKNVPPRTVRRSNEPGLVEIRIVFLGPFNGLMALMAKMESELGGVRLVRASWGARSPEEVKLTLGLRYRTMPQPNKAPEGEAK